MSGQVQLKLVSGVEGRKFHIYSELDPKVLILLIILFSRPNLLGFWCQFDKTNVHEKLEAEESRRESQNFPAKHMNCEVDSKHVRARE